MLVTKYVDDKLLWFNVILSERSVFGKSISKETKARTERIWEGNSERTAYY